MVGESSTFAHRSSMNGSNWPGASAAAGSRLGGAGARQDPLAVCGAGLAPLSRLFGRLWQPGIHAVGGAGEAVCLALEGPSAAATCRSTAWLSCRSTNLARNSTSRSPGGKTKRRRSSANSCAPPAICFRRRPTRRKVIGLTSRERHARARRSWRLWPALSRARRRSAAARTERTPRRRSTGETSR